MVRGKRPHFRGLQVGPWRVGWISDAQKRKREQYVARKLVKRAKVTARTGHVHLPNVSVPCPMRKYIQETENWAGVSTTCQSYDYVAQIAQGNEVTNRRGNKIYCRKLYFRGNINWGSESGCTLFRIVVALCDDDDATSFTLDSYPYGVQRFSNTLRHIYFDKTYVRKTSTIVFQPIKVKVNLKGIPIQFSGADAGDNMHKTIKMFVVSDKAPTSNMATYGWLSRFYWSEK